MQAVCLPLVAVILLAHAMLGCPCHYGCQHDDNAIACEQDEAQSCDADAHLATNHACGTTAVGHHSDGPCHCQWQCATRCTYLSSPKVRLDQVDSIERLDVLAVLPFTDSDLSLSTSTFESTHGPPLSGSLRLHLWHQILLI
ncbi:MAG: hypothetical protein K8T25_01250 [Planctomycetia bacterium]|nr:hypothetical protein [Planctomycetia bacterium]